MAMIIQSWIKLGTYCIVSASKWWLLFALCMISPAQLIGSVMDTWVAYLLLCIWNESDLRWCGTNQSPERPREWPVENSCDVRTGITAMLVSLLELWGIRNWGNQGNACHPRKRGEWARHAERCWLLTEPHTRWPSSSTSASAFHLGRWLWVMPF